MKRINFGLSALAFLAIGSCSEAPQREARLTELTHGIVKSLPVLVEGTNFENSVWKSAVQDQVLNQAVEIARSSEAFEAAQARIDERYMTQEIPPLFDGIGDEVSKISQTDAASSGGSGGGSGLPSSPGVGGGGGIPSDPALGGGSIPTTPDLGSGGSLPSAPATAGSSFSPTPALFAKFLYSGGSSSSASSLAEAYCNMFAGLISYFDRCVSGFADMKTAVNAAYGSATCKASLGPAFEEALSSVPSAFVDVVSCMGDAFEAAACDTNDDGLSTKLGEAMEAKCGVQFQE